MGNIEKIVRFESSLKNRVIEWIGKESVIVSQNEKLFIGKAIDSDLELVGKFPVPFWKKTLSRFRLLQRLFRCMYYNVIQLGDGSVFVTFNKQVALFNRSKNITILPLDRPCRVLRGGCAVDNNENIYFGEYFGNTARDAVFIYCYRSQENKLEKVYQFDSNTVRHVHGIYWDAYTHSLWCTTGDRNNECKILKSSDGFKTVDIVGQGDESWRCVSLCFAKDAIYYATDSEFQQNYIYKIDRQSGKRKSLGPIDGLVYYSCSLNTSHFFGVSAELCPGQKGSEYKSRSAGLWQVNTKDKLYKITAFEKDVFSPKYFMPGTLHFPRYETTCETLYFHCIGVKGGDNKTFSYAVV